MPSQMMDQHCMSPPSCVSGELPSFDEKQVGFSKKDTFRNQYGVKPNEITITPRNLTIINVASSPLEEITQLDLASTKYLEIPEHKVNCTLKRHAIREETSLSHPFNLWSSMDSSYGMRCKFDERLSRDKNGGLSSLDENGLFSSSLSELNRRNLRLLSNDALYGHSVDTIASHYKEDEPSDSLEDIEAHAIGNLLPNDDELLHGVIDRLGHVAQSTENDDIGDLDLFNSVGGMDLGEEVSLSGQRNSEFIQNSYQLGGTNISLNGEYPYSEHPSRTLFVRNINNNVEDFELHTLFEQYGDIHTLYTTCKHRDFVMVSYHDIRAACSAIKALHGKLLRGRMLDIHYSIPKDNASQKDINHDTLVISNNDSFVSNNDLLKIFGAFGDIKEIRETPHQNNQKIVEFYDARAAHEALHALSQSDIVGKKIKLDPSHHGGAQQSSIQSLTSELELEQGEPGFYLPSSLGLSQGLMNRTNISETVMGRNEGTRASISPFVEKFSHHGKSSSVPSGLPSLFGADLTDNSVNHIRYALEGMTTSYRDLLLKYSDEFDGAFENSYGFPSHEDACRPHVGNQYLWGNSKHPQGPTFMWSNSHSSTNGICSPHHQHRVHGPTRCPSHMLNSSTLMNGYHVGSTPTINPSIWEIRNSYLAGSLEASGFYHQGPIGSTRLCRSNPMYHMNFVSHDRFSHVARSCMDLPYSRNSSLHPQQERCMIYPSQVHMKLSSSFEPSSEHPKTRRNDNNSSQVDNKKQYELDIARIKRGEDKRTTLMVKNIPNKYTSKMLMATIDERLRGTYDFIYLPIDFKNKCNVGYAFINMISPDRIIPLYENFNGKRWEKFNSEKIASIAYARIQGKAALIAHFQNSSLMNEDKRCRPILFHNDGHNVGDQVPFPMSVNIRSRSIRSRSSSYEDGHQESLPNLASNVDCSYVDSSLNSCNELD